MGTADAGSRGRYRSDACGPPQLGLIGLYSARSARRCPTPPARPWASSWTGATTSRSPCSAMEPPAGATAIGHEPRLKPDLARGRRRSIRYIQGLPRGARSTERRVTLHATELPSCAGRSAPAVSFNRSRHYLRRLETLAAPAYVQDVMTSAPHHSATRTDRLIFGS
jgi:hypothetical protein